MFPIKQYFYEYFFFFIRTFLKFFSLIFLFLFKIKFSKKRNCLNFVFCNLFKYLKVVCH